MRYSPLIQACNDSLSLLADLQSRLQRPDPALAHLIRRVELRVHYLRLHCDPLQLLSSELEYSLARVRDLSLARAPAPARNSRST